MDSPLLMLDLMRAFYWFDEQLRTRLAQRGWQGITRSQSLVLTNIANGVSRASHIAANIGVSRQAMSQLIGEMIEAGLVEVAPDPLDKRAQLVRAAPAGAEIREAAQAILRDLEGELERNVGKRRLQSLREALGGVPVI